MSESEHFDITGLWRQSGAGDFSLRCLICDWEWDADTCAISVTLETINRAANLHYGINHRVPA